MKKVSFIDIIFLVLSLVFLFGTKCAFHACAPKQDGSWMLCHWAEQVIVALGVVFTVLSLSRFFIRDNKIKAGISISFVPLSVLTLLVPGVLVNLCMMKEMRCHTVMRPSVVVLSILIAALSVVDSIVLLKNAKKAA